MRTRVAVSALALLVVAIVAALLVRRAPPPSGIRFAPAADPPIDFARLESELPLSARQLETLTPQQLHAFTQEQIDQIYGRLTAGGIPDGAYDGDLFFPRGSDGGSRLAEIAGGRLASLLGNVAVRQTEFLARTLWKGKLFSRSERVARTRIDDLALLAPLLKGNGDAIEKTTVGGHPAFLLFPSRIYCGQSLLDSRRESIVLDYLFADDLPGYREHPDALAGRNGLRIRDELRMVRPGLYLGRVYMDRVFVLNVILFSADASSAGLADFRAGRSPQDCWTGTQSHAAASR